MNKSRQMIVMLFLGSFLFCGNAWSSQAGLVQFVHGDVTVTAVSGAIHPAHKGDAINEGDTLISARDASAQIKMDDGGFIAVRPNTRLKFDSFKFSKKPDKPESAFFSLFKGGFRAITGLIGRIRHEDYKITTPAATIGIRGTDHETVMVLPNDPLVLAGQAAPGAYNKVNVGETSITTNKGTINVLPNQMGFAGGLNQMPQIQPVNTNLFTVTPAPAPGAKMDGGGDSGGDSGTRDTAVVDSTPQAAGGDSGTTTDTTTATTTTTVANTAPPSVVVSPTQALTSGSATLPAQAAGGIGLFYSDASGVWTTGGGGIVQTTTSASGGLGGFTVNLGGCIANCVYTTGFQGGSLGSASILEQGSSTVAGNIHWGRWFGATGAATITGLPAGATFLNSNLIYIGGDIPTMPVSGTATYAAVGGTSPVDYAGQTGTFLGANVSVNFANLGISVSNLKVTSPLGDTFTMAGSGTFMSNGLIPTVPMTGNCTGTCSFGRAMTGDYAGSFTGVNAAGLALGYHIATGTGQQGAPLFEIMGTQAFVRQ